MPSAAVVGSSDVGKSEGDPAQGSATWDAGWERSEKTTDISLGALFPGGGHRGIDLLVAAAEARALDQPVGSAGYGPATLRAVASDVALPLFDRRFSLAVSVAVSGEILAGGTEPDPFGTGERLAAPAGTSVARLSVSGKLELGATATFGSDVDRSLSRIAAAFDGMAPELQAHVSASFQASFSGSLYETLTSTVGRAATVEPGWVRVRLERADRRHLTLGARVELRASYDLGSSLVSILEHTLDQSPSRRYLDLAQEVTDLVAAGRWQAVQTKISARGAAILEEVHDDRRWRDLPATAPAIVQLAEDARTLVAAYRKIDVELQGFWDVVLRAVDLGPGSPLRRDLQTLAAIEPTSFDPASLLTDDDLRRVVALLETLSGASLEEILLADRPAVEAALTRATAAAGRLENLLDATPRGLLDRLHAFADRTGIVATVERLSAHATSVEALRAAANARLEALVRRLVGKAWAAIDAVDLARLRAWASRVGALLDDAAGLEDRWKAHLAGIRGELGFSLALEIDRLTERHALVDLEVDPASEEAVDAVRSALAQGSVQKLLSRLAAIAADGGTTPPYHLRDAAFSDRRARTNSASLFLSVLGLSTATLERSESCELRIVGRAAREATYSGGFVDRRKPTASPSSMAGAWLEVGAHGGGIDPNAPYDGPLERTLHLSFQWQNRETTLAELAALEELLRQLGFPGAGGSRGGRDLPPGDPLLPRPPPAPGGPGRLPRRSRPRRPPALEHRLPERRPPLARRGLVTRTLARPSIVTVGRLLAALVADEDFQEAWTRGLPAFQSRTRSHLVPLPGGILYRATVFDPTAGGWSPPFVALRSLVRQVGIGFAAHGDLARAAAAPASHRAFSALARTAATAFARISARDWESPPFDLWLVLARLSRLAPETLAGVRGLALLRWRRPGESEWQPPRGRRLSAGLSQELRRTGVFPFG